MLAYPSYYNCFHVKWSSESTMYKAFLHWARWDAEHCSNHEYSTANIAVPVGICFTVKQFEKLEVISKNKKSFLISCSLIIYHMPLALSLFFPRIDEMSSAEPVIRSRRAEKEVNGISTQVVCTEFSNYIFVVLTQYGKIGTLISVTSDSRSNDIGTPTFSTKVLLGKEEVRWWREWLEAVQLSCCHTLPWNG